MNSYIITGTGVSMYTGGKAINVEISHPRYNEIIDAIRAGGWDAIPNLVNTARAIADYANRAGVSVDVEAAVVTYDGEPMRGYLVERILDMMSDGFDIDPLANYLSNLMLNPSNRAVDELHGFNEYGKMPITPDGHFIAWKRIKGGYDTYTGKVLNKPAEMMTPEEKARLPYIVNGVTVELVDGVTTVSMPRNKVDDRSDYTCSHGLHFCSQEYLRSFSGDQIVILKINPADVVSIPVDYNNTKGRCAKYQVIGILSQEDFEKAMGNDKVIKSSVYVDQTEPETEDASDYEDENDDVVYDFLTGYNDGYRDGRKGNDNSFDYAGDGIDGYVEGHKDGRGHKPRRYS